MASKADKIMALKLSAPLIVFTVFLALRLAGLVGWSWWWVTSPLWIAAVIAVLTFAVGFLVLSIYVRRHRR